jgi:hypothetical protein
MNDEFDSENYSDAMKLISNFIVPNFSIIEVTYKIYMTDHSDSRITSLITKVACSMKSQIQ